MPDVPVRRDQNDALPHLAGRNPEDWICCGLPGGADQAASHARRRELEAAPHRVC